ncbi:hypothetical protein BB347_15525 [Natronorubrum daqingense]|uniref:PGF-CTERM protein n=3 Tax=Natronorubrum daqingense TaxID=588898 RepID=A0A1P8RGY1_9EURY|nr:hypothetical protein BB347_15525 [Natronorubrum daqingense]
MMEKVTRSRVLVATVVAVMLAIGIAAAAGAVPLFASGDSTDRPDDPSTEETVGYVEGYWYDDELDADDGEDAVVDDEGDLEEVIYRSMARVEEIRGLTFEEEVPVDVISREEFQEDHDEMFVETGEDEELQQNVTYEALFMVDSETDAEDEFEAMYGDSVGGYYDPATNEIVLVSDSPDEPEVDEVILGHELLHALQDQHFDLASYDRETIDQDAAKNGLIEGDAVTVEQTYDQHCDTEWECLPSAQPPEGQVGDLNWGIYLLLMHPYEAGPEYVDSLLEGDDWSAVDDAYDDAPASSSDVIHTDEDRESGDVTVDDDSSDSWEQFETDDGLANETVGEAGMVSMLGGDAMDPLRSSVIEETDLLTADLQGVDYDQPYTDGWAGDELVTYVDSNATDTDAVSTSEDAGYVWESEWTSEEDAEEFVDGYTQLLELNDAQTLNESEGVYSIDDGYEGAYALDVDGESVTIVRGPSVDELNAIEDGVVAEDLEVSDDPDEPTDGDAGTDDTGSDDEESGDADDADDASEATDADNDSIPGFAASSAVVALAVAVFLTRLRR